MNQGMNLAAMPDWQATDWGEMSNDQYTADIQILSGCLRIFAPGQSYGDAYVAAASLLFHDSETVEIVGITRQEACPQDNAPNLLMLARRPICDAARKLGVRTVQFRRLNRGRDRMIQLNTTTLRILRNV